jgi:hypothetical protein
LNAAKVLNQLARQMAAKKVHFLPLLISVWDLLFDCDCLSESWICKFS